MYGERRRDTLGRFPDITLGDARAKALSMRALIANDIDPSAEKHDEKIAFADALPMFIKMHCEMHNKPSTIISTRRLLERECLPVWKRRPVVKITRRDVNAILDKMIARGSPGAANKARAAMSKFFSWCASRDFIPSNPCDGVKAPTRTRKRDRVLDDSEIAAVWQAAQATGYPFGTIVQILLLTAQRRGEVSQMQWDHIDFENEIWTIPGELTKNGEPQHLPLSPAVLNILRGIHRHHDRLVFPARGNEERCFSGFGKSKARLNAMLNIPHWTLHDLRRTATTKMAELDVLPHVAERVLNHTSGTFGGVAGVYNRYKYLNSMRLALFSWDDHIQKLVASS